MQFLGLKIFEGKKERKRENNLPAIKSHRTQISINKNLTRATGEENEFM